MANCDSLLTLIAKLSSVEREYLDLKLTPKYRNHLLSPCSLSTQQFAELICVLRPLLPELEPALIAIASALPPTQDFGITTQGPAETPYDVPANTVTYETIAYTPCGGLLRKVITTTYSGRNVSNQYKVSGAGYDPVSHNGYGITAQLAAENWFSQLIFGANSCPALPNGLWLQSLGTITADTVYCEVGTTSGGTLPCPGGSAGSIAAGTITSGLIIYYLDTHIIWTYEIV